MTNRMIKRKVFYIQLKLISPLSVSSGEDEWTDSPQEMKFRLINLEVANRGINVERIFIFSKDKIKQFRNNKTLKIYMQSNIKTLLP